MCYTETFERVEHKYLLTKQEANQLFNLIKDHIVEDVYPRYTLYNIYYDSDDYQMIRKSIEGPQYKEKLRLRSYGEVKDDGFMYLEMKKKYDGIVYKRRIQIPSINETSNSSQIKKELQYMKDFYEAKEKVFIAYDRIAYSAKKENDVRITFDTNIRYRFENLKLTDLYDDNYLLNDDQVLLEVKVMNRYPLWLTHALSALKLTRTSFSKYGTIYAQAIHKKEVIHV